MSKKQFILLVVVVLISIVFGIVGGIYYLEEEGRGEIDWNEILIKQTGNLQRQITDLTLDFLFLDHYKTVTLDPLSLKKYQRIDTSSGFFLISLQDAKPYLDGYKLLLHIGNPTSATYNGFTLKVKWGRKYDYTETLSDSSAYDKWKKSLREKEESFTEKLLSGCWNKVELIISPAKPEEIGHIELSMDTNIVSLK